MELLAVSWKSSPRMLLPLVSILSILFQYQGSYFLVESFNFSFDSFNSDSCNNGSRLICWGSVSSANGSLYLTPELQQQEGRKIGRVLFSYPFNAWPASFSTIFTVRFLTNSTVSGDGIAFVIAQDDRPSPPQSFGSYIGMLDPSTEGGVLHQLAVELDSYQNEHEIDGNHMAVVTTSVQYPVAVKSLSSIGIDLRSGRDITVKIDYDGWSKNLQMSAAYTGNPLTSFLSHKILMEDTVPQSAYVGFTASTAYFVETHQVLSWNFTSFELDKKSLKKGVNKNVSRIVLSVVIPTVVVLLLVMLFVVQRRKKSGEGTLMMRRGDIEMLTRNAANAPRFYTYRQLAKATRNFNKENLVGAGGFGCVYKGVLADPSTIIAVKKINATSGQGTLFLPLLLLLLLDN